MKLNETEKLPAIEHIDTSFSTDPNHNLTSDDSCSFFRINHRQTDERWEVIDKYSFQFMFRNLT